MTMALHYDLNLKFTEIILMVATLLYLDRGRGITTISTLLECNLRAVVVVGGS